MQSGLTRRSFIFAEFFNFLLLASSVSYAAMVWALKAVDPALGKLSFPCYVS